MTAVETPRYAMAIAKGSALIDDTAALLRAWIPGEPLDDFTARVLSADVLAKATHQRARDIVRRVFAPRYLLPTDEPARHMKVLLESFGREGIRDLALLYSCQKDHLLKNATIEVYWDAARAGQTTLETHDLDGFFQAAFETKKIPQPWSPVVTRKVARGIIGAWVGFHLLDERRKGTHRILPYSPQDRTVVYFGYVLHFSGLTDQQVITHSDWQLFGLSTDDVIARMARLSNHGWWEAQVGGDVVRITWRHGSAEEMVNALTR
jgi:hypothetical protein